jgi:hypothetical protein
MKRPTFVFAAISSAVVAGQVCAQSLPPIRQIGTITGVSKDSLGAISTLRHLPNGRVLVNDIIGRRVIMFDSSLSNATVVADTTSATANAYGVRPGGLIAYRGDSTLFVDPASLSMLLIDPNGKITRVMSAPRAQDVGFLVGGPFGNPGFDPSGKLVYRAPPNFGAFGRAGPGAGPGQFPTPPDSAALVRFDLTTRKLDTATFFKTPKISLNITQSPDGGVRVTTNVNPLPQGDDWALLPDGTIALVRGKDFHIDWLHPDGKVTSSPKMSFNWERLTDEAKVAFIDSARVAIEKLRASGQFGFGGAGPQLITRDATQGGGPGSRPNGTRGDTARIATAPAPTPAPNAQTGTITVTSGGNTTVAAVGPGGAGGPLPPLTMISPSELPDYKPPFAPGSTRVDLDGNLWIRTSQNVDARPVYDVVNPKGELIDRVQLPSNRVLAGFGENGVAYLAVRDGATAHLEKARVK